jgi:hypothetical protein
MTFSSFTRALWVLLTTAALLNIFIAVVGRDSAVGIATMGWTVRGSNPGGARFSAPVQTYPGPASYTLGTGSFPGAKQQGRGADHPPQSSADVKERIQLIPLFHLWAFVACYRVNYIPLSLPLPSLLYGTSLGFRFLFLFFSIGEHMLAMHLDPPIGALSISVTLHGRIRSIG